MRRNRPPNQQIKPETNLDKLSIETLWFKTNSFVCLSDPCLCSFRFVSSSPHPVHFHFAAPILRGSFLWVLVSLCCHFAMFCSLSFNHVEVYSLNYSFAVNNPPPPFCCSFGSFNTLTPGGMKCVRNLRSFYGQISFINDIPSPEKERLQLQLLKAALCGKMLNKSSHLGLCVIQHSCASIWDLWGSWVSGGLHKNTQCVMPAVEPWQNVFERLQLRQK